MPRRYRQSAGLARILAVPPGMRAVSGAARRRRGNPKRHAAVARNDRAVDPQLL